MQNQQSDPQLPVQAPHETLYYPPGYGHPTNQGYYIDPSYAAAFVPQYVNPNVYAQQYDPHYAAAYSHQYVDPNVATTGTQLQYIEERSNLVPHHGNKSNFNINSMLFNNITASDYFLALDQLPSFREVIGKLPIHHIV